MSLTTRFGCTALAAAGAVGAMTMLGGAARERPTAGCDVESLQAAAPKDTTVVSAQMVDTPVRNCRVEGYVTTTNPGPNRNNFRLQLPEAAAFGGRYYFIGMGGSAGYVPTESQIPSGNPVVKGFAVAGTDTGHQAHLLDWSFLADPAKAVDHIHRGAHVVAVATQRMTKAYYGVDRIWRYHSGCSGGGRMGMEAMVNHPEDFDGVLLGWPGGPHDPGKPAPPSRGSAFDIQVAEMTREPGSWLSPAKLKFAEEQVTSACDMTDGAKDDMVWDHRLCKFDFNTLKCRGADSPNCLTQPEITSIENLLAKTAMPITNMTQWTFLGPVPPPWSPEPSIENMSKTSSALVIQTTWARTYLDQPDRDIVKNPLTNAELEAMRAAEKRIGFNVTDTPDISGYAKAGGKAIFWAGVSDPCCSNIANENYMRFLEKTMGGPSAVARWAAFYHIPGAGHCGGGAGPNDHADQLLGALVDWVEDGKAPGGVEMHRGADRAKLMFRTDGDLNAVSGVRIPQATGPSRDFLVCRWPAVSVFDKTKADVPGAVMDARNWSCKASRS